MRGAQAVVCACAHAAVARSPGCLAVVCACAHVTRTSLYGFEAPFGYFSARQTYIPTAESTNLIARVCTILRESRRREEVPTALLAIVTQVVYTFVRRGDNSLFCTPPDLSSDHGGSRSNKVEIKIWD